MIHNARSVCNTSFVRCINIYHSNIVYPIFSQSGIGRTPGNITITYIATLPYC